MLFAKVVSQLKTASEYTKTVVKWLVFSTVIGFFGALLGILFHFGVDSATHFRTSHPNILFLLPLSGIVIVFLYKKASIQNDKGTNLILDCARNGESIPFRIAPLIIISTALTHLCGGSAGREGAALQIGGSIGALFARIFKLNQRNVSACITCGMSAVFSAVFLTPLTAAFFALEVVNVGIINSALFLPSLLSSLVAFTIATAVGIPKTEFALLSVPTNSLFNMSKVVLLALVASLVGILFVFILHKTGEIFKSKISNKYIRIVTGSAIVIIVTLLISSTDYLGAGMDIITKAVELGQARPEAFLLKMLLTAVTLGAGFKGGEIVPTFFVGATFGAFFSHFLALDPSFGAGIGLIVLFSSLSNCPIASLILSVELFGSEGILLFALAIAVSYIVSGNCGLYSSQKIIFSKLGYDLTNTKTS